MIVIPWSQVVKRARGGGAFTYVETETPVCPLTVPNDVSVNLLAACWQCIIAEYVLPWFGHQRFITTDTTTLHKSGFKLGILSL